MRRRARLALGLILAGHIGLSVAVNFITPIFEGPDEPNHFLFIRYLQTEGRLPVQGTERDAVRAHHPPAYFALGALLTAWVPQTAPADFASLGLRLNPRYWFRFDDPEPANKSVFLHHGPDERWPYQGQALAVHTARLLSLAGSLLAVGLTYAAARQLRPADDHLALLAAGLIAFNPMVVFMSGVVQNDTSALAAGAAVVLVVGWVLRRTPGRLAPWLWVGVVLALGILFKAGLLVLAAPVAAAALYQAWCAGARWPVRLRGASVAALGVLLPVAAIDGWWFVRNQVLYGDWTANASIVALWGPLTREQQVQFLPLALATLSTGLLGRFGNGGIIEFSRWVYAAAGLLALIGLAGLGRAALRRRGSLAQSGTVLWWLHALTVGVVTVSVFAFALKFNGGATGKYLFPAFPSLALLLAGGWLAGDGRALAARQAGRPLRATDERANPLHSWAGTSNHGRRRTVITAALLALSLGASVYAIFGLLWPAYGPPRRPWPFEMNGATALEADLGGAARILAYRLDREQLRPGDTLRITAYWLPEAVTPQPYTVFVHLYTPGLGTLAQQDVYPGGGTYPTDVWVPGRPFVDTYYLHLPFDAPAVNGAQVLLGLYDEQTGQRLAATGADAGPGGTDWIQFGQVTIAR